MYKFVMAAFYTVLLFGVSNCKNNKNAANENNSIPVSVIEDADSPVVVVAVNAGEVKLEAGEASENENIEEDVLEYDVNNIPIPETYEEALELMDKLKIKNVVLEKIMINNEVYTVVECKEGVLTIGDWLVDAYDIPDTSGNILFSLSTPLPKTTTYVTCVAIVEEPYISEKGNKDNWVKIRMDDGRVGWIKGEYTGLDRGGIKYQTRKNIWLEDNYASHWR
jgi:hypothetical protein